MLVAGTDNRRRAVLLDEPIRWNLMVGICLVAFVSVLTGFGSALLGSRSGEVAAALGGVLGGLAGAFGAYVGVMTAIKAQAWVRGQWAFTAGHGWFNSLILLDFDPEFGRKKLK